MLVLPWKIDFVFDGWAIPWKHRRVSYYPVRKKWGDLEDAGDKMMDELNAIVPDRLYKIEQVKKILRKNNGTKRGKAPLYRFFYHFIVVDGTRCWKGVREAYRPGKDEFGGFWNPDYLDLVMSGQFGKRADIPPTRAMAYINGRHIHIDAWTVSARDEKDGVFRATRTNYNYEGWGYDPGNTVCRTSFTAFFIKRTVDRTPFISKYEMEFVLNRDSGYYDVTTKTEEWVWHPIPYYIGMKRDIELTGCKPISLGDIGPFETNSSDEILEKRNRFLSTVSYD